MTAAHAFPGMFAEADVVIVVDEWKGHGFETAPALLSGRAFTNTARSSAQLYRLLAENGAARWHASGDRDKCAFLFDCPAFDRIMAELDRADTCLYNYLERDPNWFAPGTAADANWQRIMTQSPELARVWDVDSKHAKSLFWFVDCLLRCLAPRLSPDIRVRVVVDQQDWFSERTNRLSELKPGLVHIGATQSEIQAEVLGISDKSQPAVEPYLNLLGLVDSELWAFGRLLSLRMRDGTRVHDRYMQRAHAGPIPTEEVVIPEDAWEQMFQRHHGAHTNLKNYWVTLSNWPEARNIDLNEALAAVEWDASGSSR
jgi:hypothetical protein